jgi:hypothetical protein
MMSWFDPSRWTASCRGVVLVAAALILASPAVVAQEVGDRVRVYLGPETLIGVVSSMREDDFSIDVENGLSRSVRRADILWLERDVGTGSSAIPWAKKGLVTGGLGGGSIGLLLGLAVGPVCQDSECDHTIPEHIRAGLVYAALYTGIGAVVGSTAGLILGASTPYDDWQVIPEEGAETRFQPSVGLWQSPEGSVGLALGGRIRF